MPRSRQANNKTQAHDGSVDAFIATVEPARRKEDAYESGRQGDSFLVGFSPRKDNMVVYIMPGFASYADLRDKSVKDMRRKYAEL